MSHCQAAISKYTVPSLLIVNGSAGIGIKCARVAGSVEQSVNH
jgi:hypothetical protein